MPGGWRGTAAFVNDPIRTGLKRARHVGDDARKRVKAEWGKAEGEKLGSKDGPEE